MKKSMFSKIISFILAVVITLSIIPMGTFIVSAASNEQKIYNYLKDTLKLNTAAACAVLANIEGESSFEHNKIGDGGTSYGICQWHNESGNGSKRWDDLKNYCNKNGYDWKSLEGQLNFLGYELKNDYYFKNNIWNYLQNISNTKQGAYDAAKQFCKIFENPDNLETVSKNRGNRAKEFYAKYADNYPAIPALKISRIRQSRKDVLCYWCSMATVQAYCLGTYTYGGKTNSYRTGGTDYDYVDAKDAVSKKIGTYNGYANGDWNLKNFPVKMSIVRSGLGNNEATYIKIYKQLAQGKPVIVYTGKHASVVIAYNGPTDEIKASGFTVMEITKDGNWWSNSKNYFEKYANNPQKDSASGSFMSCYVTLSSWLDYGTNAGHSIIQLCYPTNAPDVTPDISITSKEENNITNNSATIGANLSQKIKLQEYGYVVSTKKADVEVDLTKSDNRKDTSTRDYVTNKSSESKNSVSMTVNKILGKDLAANTTYYYKMFIKANGSWFQSKVDSFKTANIAPGNATLSVSEANAHIGIDDAAAVSWSESSNAESYILNLYYDGSVIYSENDIKGTAFAFPAACFSKVGEYTVELSAKNDVKTVKMPETVTVTVHDDVTATFVDSISGSTIETQQVTYGHSASTPADPVQYGYTFKRWDKSFDNLKENITVTAVYEANIYTVNFVDGVTGTVYKTEKVRFNTAATAPEKSELKIPAGHEFECWDKDFSTIQGDTTVSTVYSWYSSNYALATFFDADDNGYADTDGYADATRNEDKNGYDVSVKVTNITDEIVKGRLVVVLKTESGYQYAETESSAFSISAGGTKEIDVFILSDILAYSVEVYTINDYETSGVLAAPVTENVDNSGAWSDWIEYTGELPVVEGKNGVTHVETRKVESPDLYRYKVKETTTSYATSMSGWTRGGYAKVKDTVKSGYVDYVASWPKGFDKTNKYYTTTYKSGKKSPADTETQIVVIDSDKASGEYIYWHWCRGRSLSDGPYDSKISNGVWDNAAEKAEFKKFHAFITPRKVTGCAEDAFLYKYSIKSQCSDSYYWIYKPVEIRRQTYSVYNKLYTYTRWPAWSEYSEENPLEKTVYSLTGYNAYKGKTTKLSELTKGTDYEIETVNGSTTYEYRYKTADLVATDIPVSADQIKPINGKVDKAFAGKEATVFVHKYTQPSDFTTEYAGFTTVGDDGSIIIENAKLREALSVETGDFKVVVSIEGNTGLIELQIFEAPKPKYTVEFYDYDADGELKKVIYRAVVEQGETITAPSVDLLTIPEGQKFARWSESTVNVNGDLKVYPEIEPEEYVVVFVDWGSREVSLKEMLYGDVIEPPTAAKVEDMNVTWDMSNATAVEEILDDGTIVTKYIVTQNTVITTKYSEKENVIGFIKPDDTPEKTEEKANDILKGETPKDNEIIKVSVPSGDHIDPPAEIEENPEYIFYGWKNIDTGEYLTDTTAKENATYYPVYEFAYTTDNPYADIITGEYDDTQTVTLSCDTENSVIWYTTDGSDPVTSETAILLEELPAKIEVTKSCVLNFYASSFGMNDSSVCTELYAINNISIYYYIYTVYTNIPSQGNSVFNALIRENSNFDESKLGTFEGYELEGLYYDEEYSDKYDSELDSAYESTTLYANYIPNVYTVTFVDDDGSEISTQHVEYASSAEPPEVAEREGYVFVGWDSDEYQCVTRDGIYKAKYVAEDEYARIKFSRKSASSRAGDLFDIGKLVRITPTELSDTSVSWSTSNPEIATVDHNGIVTMLKEGRATITATVDTSGESAEFVVIVKANVKDAIVLGTGTDLGIDSSGCIRGLKPCNTVAETKNEFSNYDPENEDVSDTELVFVDVNGKELDDNSYIGTGTAVKLVKKDDGEILDSRVFVVLGDYDGDGYINNVDSVRTARYNVDKENPNDYQMIAMDVNGDGYVNNRDTAMISRYLVGKEIF